jgi:hypothetical protein
MEATALMIQKLVQTEPVKTQIGADGLSSGYAPTVVNEHITAHLYVKVFRPPCCWSSSLIVLCMGLICFEKELQRLSKKKDRKRERKGLRMWRRSIRRDVWEPPAPNTVLRWIRLTTEE